MSKQEEIVVTKKALRWFSHWACLLRFESECVCSRFPPQRRLVSDSLDSIEPRCICVDLTSSQTPTENTAISSHVFLLLLFCSHYIQKALRHFCVLRRSLATHGTRVLCKLMMSSSDKTHAQFTLLPEHVGK